MEQEYKYKLPENVYDAVFNECLAGQPFHHIEMDARYLDTPSGFLYQHHTSLRLRREVTDGVPETVACIKIPAPQDQFGGALRHRLEYECAVDSLLPAFDMLPIPETVMYALTASGAPENILSVAWQEGFLDKARVVYTRLELLRQYGNAEFTLCLDRGLLGTHPFSELEVEHKNGCFEDTERFAAELAEKFRLEPQPLSKLARALA